MRTNFDFAPYRRSTVGFDRLFNLLEAGAREDDGYPPFDILKDGEDSYRITLAVAGFRPEDIEVVAQQNQLTVTGKRAEDNGKGDYLHRGIMAKTPFLVPLLSLMRDRPAPENFGSVPSLVKRQVGPDWHSNAKSAKKFHSAS